ncbi:MAG: hypothetical protein AAB346_06435, partial [Pseudomonadota bacterium]
MVLLTDGPSRRYIALYTEMYSTANPYTPIKDNHLPKENVHRFTRIFVRAKDKGNDRHRRLRHRIWLLGAAGLVTS